MTNFYLIYKNKNFMKGIFSFNFRDNYNMNSLKDSEYSLMCLEFNKIINTYSVKQDIFSDQFWVYLKEDFGIIDEKNIVTNTEISIDEKNKKHINYKYYIKCYINDVDYLFFVFYDEKKGWDDDDYLNYVTENEKMNKIDNLIIYYDSQMISTEYVETNIIEKLNQLSYIPSNKNQFFTITTNQYGYGLEPSYIKEMNIDIELNYGKKFVNIYKKIIDKLENEHHGLFLFHGQTGTGKTSLIRKLISELSEKKIIIYVPNYMMYNMASPEMISFIAKFKNVILLLEDSENILANTVDNRTEAVANILNMSDGLLNDIMQIQIISTFNTKSKLIDEALMRSGRLMVNYEFKKLSKENANKLAKKLKLDKKFDKDTSLAEIYGSEQIINDDLETKKKIGF